MGIAMNKERSPRFKMIWIGAVYIIVVYITYLLAGLGLIWFQSFLINMGFSFYLGLVVGIILLVFGVLEIKDFFWYGKGYSLSIPARYTGIIKNRIAKVSSAGAIILGFFVSLVELPCTGGPYLAITSILASSFNILAFYYLVLYNFIFVLPLIIIVALAALGTKHEKMKDWKESQKKWMRLFAGILLIAFGLFMLLFYTGFVNFSFMGLPSGGPISLESLTLPVIIITAAIDSINPCAIGVLLLLVATLVSVSRGASNVQKG